VMIHRGTVGAMERVTAALLERYQGRLPLWLAPVQVCVMPVDETQDAPARDLLDDLHAAGLRTRLATDGSLGARIRASRQRRDAVIAVIGAAEAAAGQARVTDVAARFTGNVSAAFLVQALQQAYAVRARQVEWAAQPVREAPAK
jgi:threonyl-tRNA synthetase